MSRVAYGIQWKIVPENLKVFVHEYCLKERVVMRIRVVSVVMLTLLITSMLTLAFDIQPARSVPTIWTVDDDGPADFSSIQQP